MSESNGNSKWVMWALGLMFTVGMAAQGAQLHYVNLKFTDHGSRPHRGTVSQARFQDIYEELRHIRNELSDLEKQVARLEERLRSR